MRDAVLEAHGFLTAIASAPTTVMPSVWQQEVLGERGFASIEHARHVLGLVMRLYNQIITDLSEGNQVAPADEDDETLAGWCVGTSRRRAWTTCGARTSAASCSCFRS
jgi:yecA family protein